MNRYDLIYEKINDLYNNGSITFEMASKLNDRAYQMYVSEGSMRKFRDEVLDKDKKVRELYNKYSSTPLLKIRQRRDLRNEYNDAYDDYLQSNSKYKNMSGSDAIMSKTMEDELKQLKKKFGETDRVKFLKKNLNEDKVRFMQSMTANENCVLEDKSDILADIYYKLEENKGKYNNGAFRNHPKRPLIKHNEDNSLNMSDEELHRLRMYDHGDGRSSRGTLFSHIDGRISKDAADKLNNQLAEMDKKFYDSRVKNREAKINKKEIH